MLSYSNPKNNPHFEQPQKITICQISNPKKMTRASLSKLFPVPPGSALVVRRMALGGGRGRPKHEQNSSRVLPKYVHILNAIYSLNASFLPSDRKPLLTLFDMGNFGTVSYCGGGGGMRAPHHNFAVIGTMIMKFGTGVKLDVFYTMVTKNL